jgi:hypothetical protein
LDFLAESKQFASGSNLWSTDVMEIRLPLFSRVTREEKRHGVTT